MVVLNNELKTFAAKAAQNLKKGDMSSVVIIKPVQHRS
jgi:hypothetical protein